VVSAASYEARVFGVHSAMPAVQARKLCPHGVFLPGDMAKYRSESRRIFAIFSRFSPLVEALSLDEAFLDLAGSERLLGPPERVAQDLRRCIREETGLTVSCGLARVKMIAKMASDVAKPDGWRLVRDDEVQAFLDPLPVGRLWGVGPVAQRKLASCGLHTIADLRHASEARLRALLGDFGGRIAALARGQDSREVEADRDARSYGEENTFGTDVRDPAQLRTTIRAHAEAVARRLRRDRVRARGVTLKLKLARPLGGGRYPLLTRSLTLPDATSDGKQLAEAAYQLLERASLAEPVRLVGVTASRIEPEGPDQLTLFGVRAQASPQRAKLNAVLDRIHERFGQDALSQGTGQVERAGLTEKRKSGELD
jgi:DNA polymerase-4